MQKILDPTDVVYCYYFFLIHDGIDCGFAYVDIRGNGAEVLMVCSCQLPLPTDDIRLTSAAPSDAAFARVANTVETVSPVPWERRGPALTPSTEGREGSVQKIDMKVPINIYGRFFTTNPK